MSAIEITRGECLRVQGTWTNEDGTPIDLTGLTLSISEAYPRALESGAVTVTDGAAGEFEVFVSAETMAKAGMGRTNWLRIAMELPGGCPDTSERFWVEVK